MTTDIRDEWEIKADKLTAPINVSLSLTGPQRIRLQRIADDKGLSLSELIKEIVVDHCNNNIGQAVITSPSFAKSTTRVTGYSGSVTRG